MPLEINEIGIRMHVRDEARAAAPDDPARQPPGGAAGAGGSDAVVEECVRRVLRVLKMQRER